MQNFEMEKYKRLNEDLLNDEENLELAGLMQRVAKDLDKTILKFKVIAKAKGKRYQLAAAKKDAIEASIAGKSSVEAASVDDLKIHLPSVESGSSDERKSRLRSVRNRMNTNESKNLVRDTQTMRESESEHDPASRRVKEEKSE